ncbi:hypothetical protein RSAG8_09697, partial [Rhizoctonia solani AG-8 WAC10335]
MHLKYQRNAIPSPSLPYDYGADLTYRTASREVPTLAGQGIGHGDISGARGGAWAIIRASLLATTDRDGRTRGSILESPSRRLPWPRRCQWVLSPGKSSYCARTQLIADIPQPPNILFARSRACQAWPHFGRGTTRLAWMLPRHSNRNGALLARHVEGPKIERNHL